MIVASQFGPPFMFSGVAVALPDMGAELGAGGITLGLVESLFLAGSVALLLPVGWLADATDKNTLYRLGLLAFGGASIIIGFISWIPAILAIRFLQGVASAVFGATGPAILADIVPAEKRGRAYGSSIGVLYAGLTLGPIVAGTLVKHGGWRAVFLVGGTVILLGYGLIRVMLPSAWRRPASSVHLPSVLLMIVAVLALVAGSATAGRGLLGYSLIASGVVLATLFTVWQRRLDHPLVDVGALMANHTLRDVLFVQFLLYVHAFSAIFMLSLYMQVSLGETPQRAGQVLAIGSALMAVVAPISGRLADRYRPGLISTAGVTCVLLSGLVARTLDGQSGLTWVIFMLVLHGLGYALFSSPNMTIIMNSAAAGSIARTSAYSAKARSIGLVCGMLIPTILISLHIGNEPIKGQPIALVAVMQQSFTVISVISAIALIVSLRTCLPSRFASPSVAKDPGSTPEHSEA